MRRKTAFNFSITKIIRVPEFFFEFSSVNFFCHPKSVQSKFQMFERETRREKILEARNKEIRLKEKTKGILGLGGAVLVIIISCI